jgi:hypothetical protein
MLVSNAHNSAVGRVGHQKRVRKLVRLILYASPVHVAVWEECYWRWRALSEILFQNLADSDDGDGPRQPIWQEVRFEQLFNLSSQPPNICPSYRITFSSGKTLLYFWPPLAVLASRRMWI